MSRPERVAIPKPSAAEPAATPPDISGGGDIVIDAQAGTQGTRPGPQPKAKSEVFSSTLGTPNVMDLKNREFDARRAKVRALALEKMADVQVGSRLPGPPIPTETAEEATSATEETAEAETDAAPKLDAKTASEIARRDREVRELRKKIRAIETGGASAAKKEAKLKELAKTNPTGVAEYLGMDVQQLIYDTAAGKKEAVKFEEETAAQTDDEKETLRRENARLRAREQDRTVSEVVQKKVNDTKDDEGKLRWPLIARVGEDARREAAQLAINETAKMRRLTSEEAHEVLEHFLDMTEAKYRRAAAATSETQRTKVPPTPRHPQRLPPKSPMDARTARDESDPRNRPTSREIAARVRARLIG